MEANGRRYDSRVTLGSLITIASVIFSAGGVVAAMEIKSKSNDASNSRIEAKLDVIIEQQSQLRERVAVLEDRSRRTPK